MDETSSPSQLEISDPIFKTVRSLRDEHSVLLKRYRNQETDKTFVSDLTAFLSRAQASGVLLESDSERFDVQDVLSYWSNVLYRLNGEATDFELADYVADQAPDLPDSECPYNDASDFMTAEFGEAGVPHRLLVGCLKNIKELRLLTVVGAAGSGRTAFVENVLLPALRSGKEIPASDQWNYCHVVNVGAAPLQKLVQAAYPSDLDPATLQSEAERLAADEGALTRLLDQQDGTSVIVMDDFEQLFTGCDDHDVRQAVANNLYGAIRESSQGDVVILILKREYLSRLVTLGAFGDAAREAQVPMVLNANELRRAILGPAELVGLKFDDGLVDRLVLEIHSEPGAVALLQFTMRRLWEKKQRNRITWDAYREVGAGSVALERAADEFYETIRHHEEELDTARYLLSRLVRPSGNRDFVTLRVSRADLHRGSDDPRAVDQILDRLVSAGLLRKYEHETETFGLANSGLVDHWPLLIDWLEEERLNQKQRLRLATAAEQWNERQRDPEALWKGSLLAEAREYDDLNQEENDFLEASQAAETRATRYLYTVIAMLAIGMMILCVLAYVAHGQRKLAESNAVRAEQNATLAKRAKFLEQNQASLARSLSNLREGLDTVSEGDLLNSIQWFDQARFEDKEASKHRSEANRIAPELNPNSGEDDRVDIEQDRISRIRMGSVLQQTPRLALSLFQAESRPIVYVDVTQDGHRAVTVNRGSGSPATSSAEIWDLATGKRLFELPNDDRVNQAVFSPDGSLVVTACNNNQAQIWDAATGNPVDSLAHDALVTSATFNRDGSQLLTVSNSDLSKSADSELKFTATVWDVKQRKKLFQLSEHQAAITHAEFNANGDQIITSSEDKTARIWNAAGDEVANRLLKTISQPEAVTWASFSPNRKLIATACRDGAVQLWSTSAADRKAKTVWRHDGAARTVVFSPDGRHMVSAGEDGTARVVPVPTDNNQLVQRTNLLRHGSRVIHACFSPDSQQVLTTSRDRTARVWDVKSGYPVTPPLRHRFGVSHGAFGPHGARVLTCSGRSADGGQLRVWLLNARHESLPTFTHKGEVTAASLNRQESSTDGSHLAIASTSGSPRSAGYVQVWDVELGVPVTNQIRHDLPVRSVGFDPTGQKLITASDDGQALRWDARTGEKLEFANRIVHTEGDEANKSKSDADSRISVDVALTWAGYSPDGRYILTTSRDKTARLWDASSGKPIGEPLMHGEAVLHGAFSPDGKYIATASADDSARIWPINRDGKVAKAEEKEIGVHTADVTSVCFSPDGLLIATTSVDQSARVWNLNGASITPAISHARAVTSAIFSPDGQMIATCSQDKFVWIWDVSRNVAKRSESAAMPTLITPPLRHLGNVFATIFDPRNEELRTASDGDMLQISRWLLSDVDQSLSIAKSSQDESVLEKVSDVLTGHVSKPPGDGTPVEFAKLKENWENLSSSPRFETVFGQNKDILSKSIEAWHHQQAASYEVLGRNEPAIWHLDKLLEMDPSTDKRLLPRRARAYFLWARSAKSESKYNSALTNYQQAIEADPNNHHLLSERADVYWQLAKLTQKRDLELSNQYRRSAIDDCTRVIDMATEVDGGGDWSAWHARAGLRAEQADSDDTATWRLIREDLEEAVRRGANNEYTWQYLAIACLLLGDQEAYRDTCDRMNQLFEGKKSSQIANLIVWTSCLGSDALQEIRDELSTAAREWKSIDRYYYLHTLAAAAYRAAQQQEGNTDTLNQYREALRLLDEAQQAQEYYYEAKGWELGEAPLDYILLALIHHELKDEQSAREQLAKAKAWRENANRRKHWAERAEVEILFREAKEKIGLDEKTDDQPATVDAP